MFRAEYGVPLRGTSSLLPFFSRATRICPRTLPTFRFRLIVVFVLRSAHRPENPPKQDRYRRSPPCPCSLGSAPCSFSSYSSRTKVAAEMKPFPRGSVRHLVSQPGTVHEEERFFFKTSLYFPISVPPSIYPIPILFRTDLGILYDEHSLSSAEEQSFCSLCS